MTKICKQCLLTKNMMGVRLGADGICELCRQWAHRDVARLERERAARERDLEQTLLGRGTGDYDCILSFSGGKDSCYLLYKLVKEYKLRVLAYTSDFDIPPNTWDNIRRTVKQLGVDHHVHTPSKEFYRRFIRHLLKNQTLRGAVHTVCYFWLDIREGDILRLAMEKNIPLIVTGYSPGQPDPERMFYEMAPERVAGEDWTPHELFDNGVFNESERDLFWNPANYGPQAKFPRVIAPFHAWEYHQADVMEKVVTLGLAKSKWYANPVLSNFTLNWLLMYSDLDKLGYNPYKPEFSQLVREGKAGRTQWRMLFSFMDWMIRKKVLLGRHVDSSLAWLDLRPEELKMKRPKAMASRRRAHSVA